MYLFTVSLLLFCNIFIEATGYEAIPSRRINTRKVNSDVQDCVCFPGGQSLIPELSNPQNNGLERLVVYLYRNVNTNEVQVFKPSPEKQTLIPNIPYTSGDLLKPVTTDTIVSLFNNNPISTSPQHYFSTHGEPIGLKIGIIDKKSDKPKPNWDFTEFPTRNDPNIYLPDQKYTVPSQLPHLYWYPSQQQPVHSHSKPSQMQNFNLPILQPQASQLDTDIRNQHMQSFDFDDSLADTSVIADTDAAKDTWDPREEKYIIPSNPYQYKPTMQPVKPVMVDELPVNNKQNLPKRFSTFDVWFKEQMDTKFQDPKLSESVKTIDTDALRPLVQKTLFDNHIHIGATGMLMDDNGTPIDLNNLELRPILIGSPVKFQALDLNSPLKFPETLPYLEGILIILISPFKILGVIPLGTTYVSSPGKATHDLPSRALQVNSPGIKYAYTDSRLNDPASNFRSFLKIPLYAGLQTQTAVQLPELTKSTKIQNPLTYAYDEPYGTNRRFKDTDVKLDYQRPNGQIPNVVTNPIKNNLVDYPGSGYNHQLTVPPSAILPSIGSPINNNWNLALGSTRKKHSALNIFPHLVFPWGGNSASHLTSNSNPLNVNQNAVNSHVGPTSKSFWEHDNKPDSSNLNFIPRSTKTERSNSNLFVSPINSVNGPTSTQERYERYQRPEFHSNHFNVGPDNKETVDSSSWNSLSNSGWEYNNEPHSPQFHPREQSTWGSEWGDAMIKSIPSLLDPETSGIKISNWYNLDGTQNQPVGENDKSIGSTRRVSTPLLKGVLKTLLQVFIENLVGKKHGSVLRRNNYETKGSEIQVNATVGNPIDKSGEIEDGDHPDFRIIGGSAATGSGSPLSNKGRSGLGII